MLTQEQIQAYAKKYGVEVQSQEQKLKTPLAQKLASAFSAPQQEEQSTFGKIVNTAADFTGGKYLAQGIGKAIAKPMVENRAVQETLTAKDKMNAMVSELDSAFKQGRTEDVKRLQEAIRAEIDSSYLGSQGSKTLTDFQSTVPTNEEIVGSTLRLAGTAASGAIGSQAAALTGASKATGILSGIGKGAATGAITGATEGAIQGAGMGLEDNKSAGGVALSALTGAGIGGVSGGVIGGVVGGISGKMRATAQRKDELKKLLETQPNSEVAQYTLRGGQVVDDPIAKEAVKQGVDEGTIATIKGASTKDKIKANKALDILEKGRFDKKYKATNRPSDVLGESVLERFKPVYKANVKAAQELDTVAKSLQGKQADPLPAVKSFIDDLDNMGVTFSKGKPVFDGSDIQELAEPQKIINTIVKRMREVGDDGYELHRLKKFIDEQVSYGKTSGGLTGKTEGILKTFRHNLDKILDTTFEQYNKINTTYADTRNAIEEITSIGGSKFDPLDKNAEKKLGTLMRRILSNANSRIDVLNALNNLQDVAVKYGGKFDDDLVTQTVFVNDLERLFGTSAPTSLAGEVTKGVQRAGTVAGKLKNTTGAIDLLLEGTGNVIENARGINDDGLIKSLRALLK